MRSVESQSVMTRQRELDLVKSIWKNIKVHLENARDRIYEEMRNYPPPIPACDQHFNYLLEERARVSRELGRMHEASKASLSHRDPRKLIIEFIRASSYIDDGAEQEIKSYLRR